MSAPDPSIHFGPFELQPASAVLLEQGAPLPVQPKVFDLLTYLARRPGELVTREELLDVLWPDVFVSEDSLFQLLRKARRALGDDARHPRWIETVHGRGYRFIGDVDVEHPETPDVFVPLAERFFGRQADLAALEAAWDAGARHVVLLGPGGIGKTRLALEHLERVEHRWVATARADLATAATVDTLVAGIAYSAGIPLRPAPPDEVVAQVGHALAYRGETLLLLDNLEQLLPEATWVLARLAALAPEIRWLLTTRTRPELDGAHVHEVRALDPEAGHALFIARARQAGTRIPAGLSDEVDALVEALEGQPLALELAAARAPLLDPAALRKRLVRGLDLLSGRREGPERHRSLRAAIAWSFDPLSPAEQRTLCQVALFPGGFTAAQAEAIVDAGPKTPPVLDLLDALRRCSLLEPERAQARPVTGHMRLARSVREFALECLAPEDPVRARFVAWALGFEAAAAHLREHDDPETARRLLPEVDNLRAATDQAEDLGDLPAAGRLALSLASVLRYYGRRAELHRLVARFQARQEVPAPTRIRLHLRLGDMAAGDLVPSVAWELDALEALARAHLAGEPDLLRCVLLHRSLIERARGQFDAALADGRSALEARGSRGGEIHAWAQVSITRIRQGYGEEAARLAREGLARCPPDTYPQARIELEDALAWATALQGRTEEAITLYEALLPRARAHDDPMRETMILNNLGAILQDAGRFEEARRLQDCAAKNARSLGAMARLALILCTRAVSHMHVDDLAGAERDLLEAHALVAHSQAHILPMILLNLATVDALSKRWAACVARVDEALSLPQEVPDEMRSDAWLWRGLARVALGDLAGARVDLDAIDALDPAGIRPYVLAAVAPARTLLDRLEADAAEAAGDPARAATLRERAAAVEIDDTMPYVRMVSRAVARARG